MILIKITDQINCRFQQASNILKFNYLIGLGSELEHAIMLQAIHKHEHNIIIILQYQFPLPT